MRAKLITSRTIGDASMQEVVRERDRIKEYKQIVNKTLPEIFNGTNVELRQHIRNVRSLEHVTLCYLDPTKVPIGTTDEYISELTTCSVQQQ